MGPAGRPLEGNHDAHLGRSHEQRKCKRGDRNAVKVGFHAFLERLHEPAVMGLKHLKGNEEGQESAGNAEIVQANIEEAQDLLAENGRADQQARTPLLKFASA